MFSNSQGRHIANKINKIINEDIETHEYKSTFLTNEECQSKDLINQSYTQSFSRKLEDNLYYDFKD